jgi:hypothetical protein
MTTRSHWIGVVSRAHVRPGVEGGFIQLNHRKKAPLQRFYTLSVEGLRPIHDWVKRFERFWNESFDRLTGYLDEIQRQEKSDEHPD